jgi:hypothetical protein
MNKLTDLDDFLRRGWLAAMLLASLFLIPAVRAQPTEQTVQSRFLFVFDTSKNMKPRFEALQKSLNTMLATSLGGQLHAGDSMGVWTFGENLQTKGYPLQTWNPDAAATIASNLVKFVNKQSYAKSTRFEALQPSLNRVMQGSERLTVLIFCDGEGKLSGTPFDDAINRIFQEKSAEQKKARQPLVILLRSQLGQYVGADVFMPPQLVQIPSFPPLPLPPPAPKAANPRPPAPVVVGQPLIIIGKKPPASVSPPVTNPPPVIAPVAPVVPTNPPAPPTNPAVVKNLEIPPAIPPTVLPENPQSDSQNSLLIGAGLLGVAIASGLVFGLRPRRKETSLITRSLGERK